MATSGGGRPHHAIPWHGLLQCGILRIASAVNWIVRENPRKSIKELGNLLTTVWRKKAGNVGGHDYTLDQIEHDIIRP
jgi:hypothetical protein